jgi:hypothetical protein
MTAQISSGQVVFRVVDAFRGPHTGWILRLKVQDGKAPGIGTFVGSRFRVEGRDGVVRTVEVKGFPVIGGKPSDDRLQSTGRLDLHVEVVDGPEGDIVLRSLVRPA